MFKAFFNYLFWVLRRPKTNAKIYEKKDRELVKYYSSGSVSLQTKNFMTKEEGEKKIDHAIQLNFN